MPSRPRFSLRRSRWAGLRLCGLAVLLAAAFAWGLWRESYWALALPVAVGVLGALALAFWVGWTILTVRGVPPAAEPFDSRGARIGAVLLCAASAALAVVFLAGVWAGAYWALALPVAIAVLGLLAMVFHIGWAILTQRSTLHLREPGHAADGEAE